MNGERERVSVGAKLDGRKKKENWKIQRAIKSIKEAKKEFIFCFVLRGYKLIFLVSL
jgi:hypothetical protein